MPIKQACIKINPTRLTRHSYEARLLRGYLESNKHRLERQFIAKDVIHRHHNREFILTHHLVRQTETLNNLSYSSYYVEGEKLGGGNQGEVGFFHGMLYLFSRDSLIYVPKPGRRAYKKVRVTSLRPDVLKLFEEEVANEIKTSALAGQLKLKKLFTMIDACEGEIVVSMRLAGGRPLNEWLKKEVDGQRNEFNAMRLMNASIAIIQAVYWQVARWNLSHRDIKPENIMIAENDNNEFYATIVDYGFAVFHDEQPISRKGTPAYLAPEYPGNKMVKHTEKGDVYSLARVMTDVWGDAHPGRTVSGEFNHMMNAPIQEKLSYLFKGYFQGKDDKWLQFSESDTGKEIRAFIEAGHRPRDERPTCTQYLENLLKITRQDEPYFLGFHCRHTLERAETTEAFMCVFQAALSDFDDQPASVRAFIQGLGWKTLMFAKDNQGKVIQTKDELLTLVKTILEKKESALCVLTEFNALLDEKIKLFEKLTSYYGRMKAYQGLYRSYVELQAKVGKRIEILASMLSRSSAPFDLDECHKVCMKTLIQADINSGDEVNDRVLPVLAPGKFQKIYTELGLAEMEAQVQSLEPYTQLLTLLDEKQSEDQENKDFYLALYKAMLSYLHEAANDHDAFLGKRAFSEARLNDVNAIMALIKNDLPLAQCVEGLKVIQSRMKTGVLRRGLLKREIEYVIRQYEKSIGIKRSRGMPLIQVEVDFNKPINDDVKQIIVSVLNELSSNNTLGNPVIVKGVPVIYKGYQLNFQQDLLWDGKSKPMVYALLGDTLYDSGDGEHIIKQVSRRVIPGEDANGQLINCIAEDTPKVVHFRAPSNQLTSWKARAVFRSLIDRLSLVLKIENKVIAPPVLLYAPRTPVWAQNQPNKQKPEGFYYFQQGMTLDAYLKMNPEMSLEDRKSLSGAIYTAYVNQVQTQNKIHTRMHPQNIIIRLDDRGQLQAVDFDQSELYDLPRGDETLKLPITKTDWRYVHPGILEAYHSDKTPLEVTPSKPMKLSWFDKVRRFFDRSKPETTKLYPYSREEDVYALMRVIQTVQGCDTSEAIPKKYHKSLSILSPEEHLSYRRVIEETLTQMKDWMAKSILAPKEKLNSDWLALHELYQDYQALLSSSYVSLRRSKVLSVRWSEMRNKLNAMTQDGSSIPELPIEGFEKNADAFHAKALHDYLMARVKEGVVEFKKNDVFLDKLGYPHRFSNDMVARPSSTNPNIFHFDVLNRIPLSITKLDNGMERSRVVMIRGVLKPTSHGGLFYVSKLDLANTNTTRRVLKKTQPARNAPVSASGNGSMGVLNKHRPDQALAFTGNAEARRMRLLGAQFKPKNGLPPHLLNTKFQAGIPFDMSIRQIAAAADILQIDKKAVSLALVHAMATQVHAYGMVYGDLKPDNLLYRDLKSGPMFTLIDFEEDVYNIYSHHPNNDLETPSIDVFGLGVMLTHLWCGLTTAEICDIKGNRVAYLCEKLENAAMPAGIKAVIVGALKGDQYNDAFDLLQDLHLSISQLPSRRHGTTDFNNLKTTDGSKQSPQSFMSVQSSPTQASETDTVNTSHGELSPTQAYMLGCKFRRRFIDCQSKDEALIMLTESPQLHELADSKNSMLIREFIMGLGFDCLIKEMPHNINQFGDLVQFIKTVLNYKENILESWKAQANEFSALILAAQQDATLLAPEKLALIKQALKDTNAKIEKIERSYAREFNLDILTEARGRLLGPSMKTFENQHPHVRKLTRDLWPRITAINFAHQVGENDALKKNLSLALMRYEAKHLTEQAISSKSGAASARRKKDVKAFMDIIEKNDGETLKCKIRKRVKEMAGGCLGTHSVFKGELSRSVMKAMAEPKRGL